MALIAWVAPSLAAPASAQPAPATDSLPAAAGPRAPHGSTDLETRRELALLGVGAGLHGAFRLVAPHTRAVPAAGLDPIGIAWSLDRQALGRRSHSADAASDWTRDAALAFALVTSVGTAGGDELWNELARRALVAGETALISHGLTYLGKRALRRARPYAFLPDGERPTGSPYDASVHGAFESMPSGHASSAWTAAALGMTEHLLSRPQASWAERAGVGALGGGLAAATAALRVEAGQHFPSDVMVSAGIGLLTGVMVPLLHRGERPLPTARAWLEMAGGTAAGVLVGVLIARSY